MIAHYFAVSRTSDALLTLVVLGKSNGSTKPYVENIKFENLNFYDSFFSWSFSCWIPTVMNYVQPSQLTALSPSIWTSLTKRSARNC